MAHHERQIVLYDPVTAMDRALEQYQVPQGIPRDIFDAWRFAGNDFPWVRSPPVPAWVMQGLRQLPRPQDPRQGPREPDPDEGHVIRYTSLGCMFQWHDVRIIGFSY